jgi:hypothetical protein
VVSVPGFTLESMGTQDWYRDGLVWLVWRGTPTPR